jgi:hypothetical protein
VDAVVSLRMADGSEASFPLRQGAIARPELERVLVLL